jgi:hypothetical protein
MKHGLNTERRDERPKMKLVFTLALTCFLSLGERTYHCCVHIFLKNRTANPVVGISMKWRKILPLLGERAGAREVVKTNCPKNPHFICG